MREKRLKGVIVWCRSSLLGHLVLFFFCFSIPMFLMMISLQYHDGLFLVRNAGEIFVWSVLAGAVTGVFIWYGVSRRVMKKYDIH